MHSNGAIQYVDDAIAAVKALCATRAATMVWYRVPVSDGEAKTEVQTSLLSDNGPGALDNRKRQASQMRSALDNKAVVYIGA